MQRLKAMNKLQLVEAIRSLIWSSNVLRAMEAGTVRVLGRFLGECNRREWHVIRVIDHPGGIRRRTLVAIGEVAGMRRCGCINYVTWSRWRGGSRSGVDVRPDVLQRLLSKHKKGADDGNSGTV